MKKSNLLKKVWAIITETFRAPTKNSYIVDDNGKQTVLREGRDYSCKLSRQERVAEAKSLV